MCDLVLTRPACNLLICPALYPHPQRSDLRIRQFRFLLVELGGVTPRWDGCGSHRCPFMGRAVEGCADSTRTPMGHVVEEHADCTHTPVSRIVEEHTNCAHTPMGRVRRI
jgi:hypothetical protein